MEHLQTLKTIFDNGFMSHEEYNDRRQQIIDRLTDTYITDNLGPSREPDLGEKNSLSEDKPSARKELMDSGDLFINESNFTELFPTNNDITSVRSEMLTMEEKCELANAISNMDAQCLDYIIQMINSTAPNMLRFNEATGEYSFDLSEFDESTLATFHYYVKNYVIDGKPNRNPMRRFIDNKRSNSHLIWEPDEAQEESKRRRELMDIEKMSPILADPDWLRKDGIELFDVSDAPAMMVEGSEKQESHDISEIKEEKQEENKKIRIKVKIYRVEKSGTGSKPWKCDSEGCTKAFGDSSNLIKHLRTHTKEKPYVCTEQSCGKSYAHSTSLKEHMNTHTGDKPFVCTVEGCEMGFAQNSNLRRHLRVHTGDKPFVCHVCEKGFSQSTNLKSHLLTHQRSE